MLTCNTKHSMVLYLFNLQFYSFLSASFVGRNCNTCCYAIKSHEQKYWITLYMYLNRRHRNISLMLKRFDFLQIYSIEWTPNNIAILNLFL